jgi:hypothetical protein
MMGVTVEKYRKGGREEGRKEDWERKEGEERGREGKGGDVWQDEGHIVSPYICISPYK